MTTRRDALLSLSFSLLTACGAAQPKEDDPMHKDERAGHTPHVMKGDSLDERRRHGFTAPEKYAEAWNDPSRDAWQKPEEILAAMQIAPGMILVDLGAGTGYLLPELASATGGAGKVVALDVSQQMITYLDDAIEAEGMANVSTLLGTHDDPKLDAQSVDRIVTLNTWHHITNRVSYAKKLAMSLTPGGSLIVVDFVAAKTDGFGPPQEMRLSAQTVKSELEAAGFTAEIVEETLERHYIVRGVVP
ncbi:MAG: methyltransferase domain-containing protein [Myxococcota bacterium]